MLDARELRIGNHLSKNGLPHYVDMPIFMDIYYSKKNGKDHGYTAIPLTEEWLVRFGFEQREKGNFSFNENMSLRIKGFEHDYNGLWLGELQYVHQLQNLYFALTGTDLTIKEPSK